MDGNSFSGQQERLKIYLRTNQKPEYIIQAGGSNSVVSKMAPESIDAFRNFLKFYNDNDIKVILVETPDYEALYPFLVKYDLFEQTVTNIAKQYNVPFLNYLKDSLIYYRDYYYNFSHLNKKGRNYFRTKWLETLSHSLGKYYPTALSRNWMNGFMVVNTSTTFFTAVLPVTASSGMLLLTT